MPSESPLAAALAAVGDRWTLLVVDALLDRSLRFTDLAAAVDGIAPNVLARRLKRLEQEGLVVASAYSRRPPRFSYELTAPGRELASALRLLASWGARRAGLTEASTHAVCGTPLETRWWCPTCSRVVDDDEPDGLHFV